MATGLRSPLEGAAPLAVALTPGAEDHHVYLWDTTTRSARQIRAVREIDLGSGLSFDIAWTGNGSSFDLTGAGHIDGYGKTRLDLYYVLDHRRWVEGPAALG
jgi:hypothetical protein